MPKRFKDPATYTYVKAHQDLMARLQREATLIGETRDKQMQLYAAAWCRLHSIRPRAPTSPAEALVFHLSHNGAHWRENFDKFSLIERYPIEMEEWNQMLCDMVFVPGDIPRFR